MLLGSGISTAAGVPTGWQIVLDMIRRIASQMNQDCGNDPEAWYAETFGKAPDYSELLESLTKSPAERNQFLKRYIEPTEDELERGEKAPTQAHRSIAELVRRGYVRVIVTTNFDQLIENSLRDVGITPTVISTADAVDGALPLVHSSCTVIKVHGDYLDTRIKNTPEELASYDSRTGLLLDRVFDEFGLIVCGWSAEWDFALRGALERCSSRRFTTYWCVRGAVGDAAQALVDLRRASVINIESADGFFQDLTERVQALEVLAEVHPLSAGIAVARLKKYLGEKRLTIRAHDLVMQETEWLHEQASERYFPLRAQSTKEEFASRVEKYETLTETLRGMFAVGCFWGDAQHLHIWTSSLERIANPGMRFGGGGTTLPRLAIYPALILLYAGGIGSVAAGKYETLTSLLTDARCMLLNERLPVALGVNSWEVMRDREKHLPGLEDRATPTSDHLHGLLRGQFRGIIPDDDRYSECFDRFEYLSAIIFADLYEKKKSRIYVPVGRFAWRFEEDPEATIMYRISLELERTGSDWPLLQLGLFEGSLDRLRSVKKKSDAFIAEVAKGWW